MDYRDYLAGHKEDYFWFKAKKRLAGILLSKCLQPGGNAKILCLGVGTGGELEVLKRYGQVWAVDINQGVLDLVPESSGVTKLRADACTLPFEDSLFDAVVALDVFEHIHDDTQAIAETQRVLKPGGSLVLTVPSDPWLFSAHDVALGHERRYSRSGLTTLLSGFAETHFWHWNSLLFVPAAVWRVAHKKSKAKADYIRAGRILGGWLFSILNLESWFLSKGQSLPFGLTLVAIAHKRG